MKNDDLTDLFGSLKGKMKMTAQKLKDETRKSWKGNESKYLKKLRNISLKEIKKNMKLFLK